MKKLKIQRETIGILGTSELGNVQGAGGSIIIQVTRVTCACPVLTNGCTGGSCQITVTSGGTSVINPSGG